jgi:predicted RNA methylase
VFDERFSTWHSHRHSLKQIVTDDEYTALRATTLNAHYTPQIIIDAMYSAVRNMDLPRDSRILEPSCGTGGFIRRMPSSIGKAGVVGVEIDSLTARIATRLNPEAKIINSGFEVSGLENNSFDLVIGNVPFGENKMLDPDYTQDWLIHDAFFRKALDKVASGGIVAFVTSSGTLDKQNPKVREYLATHAELVGAIRLPNTAFTDSGTKVTSDIIFLKKRNEPLPPREPKPDWCYTATNADGLQINSYFVQNPQMVLGKMVQTTHFNKLACIPHEGADTAKLLNDAVKNLNAKMTITRR